MKIKPLEDRVIIKQDPPEEKYKNSMIYVPDSEKRKPQKGTVVAVGPGRFDNNGKRIPMELKVGDKVIYEIYSDDDVNEELIIIRESAVYCTI